MNKTDHVIGLVLSPCINICEVDETNICTGCYRSLNEIAAWSSLSNTEQRMVVDQANKRRDATE